MFSNNSLGNKLLKFSFERNIKNIVKTKIRKNNQKKAVVSRTKGIDKNIPNKAFLEPVRLIAKAKISKKTIEIIFFLFELLFSRKKDKEKGKIIFNQHPA